MTDYYKECEDGFIALLRTLTTYFPGGGWQVSDDDTILAKGLEYAVIVRPGAFPYIPRTATQIIVQWNVTADLCVRYVSYKESWNKMKAFRSDVFNLVLENPDLRDTPGVISVVMTGDALPQYLRFEGVPETAKPNFIIQTVRVIISAYVPISGVNF